MGKDTCVMYDHEGVRSARTLSLSMSSAVQRSRLSDWTVDMA